MRARGALCVNGGRGARYLVSVLTHLIRALASEGHPRACTQERGRFRGDAITPGYSTLSPPLESGPTQTSNTHRDRKCRDRKCRDRKCRDRK
ncbi:hypothetical protein EYF80_052388 [Liparis tanakae]|uniref:Uncharacterized protein n=1 Tax=Liparis tanakae TaxID=230148 RepID=A0A4Z2F997_9TELE|nr:hypothetical protein EYF80_052388 [Liparis tanakae]